MRVSVAAPSAGPDEISTAFTGAPGITFCRPSTMTRSPALKPGRDQPLIADGAIGLERAQFGLVVFRHHVGRGFAALIVRHGLLRNEQRVAIDALLHLLAHEHAGKQQVPGIRENGAQRDRPRSRVDRHFGHFQFSEEEYGVLSSSVRRTTAWFLPSVSNDPSACAWRSRSSNALGCTTST